MTDADRARLAYLEAEYVRQGKLLAKYQRAVVEIAEAAKKVYASWHLPLTKHSNKQMARDMEQMRESLATIAAATKTEGRG